MTLLVNSIPPTTDSSVPFEPHVLGLPPGRECGTRPYGNLELLTQSYVIAKYLALHGFFEAELFLKLLV